MTPRRFLLLPRVQRANCPALTNRHGNLGRERRENSENGTTVYDRERQPEEGFGLPLCFFVTDLHGHEDRYGKLFISILAERPDAVFLGGELLPKGSSPLMRADKEHADFVIDYLVPNFMKLRDTLDKEYPSLFVILGNDDPRCGEPEILNAAKNGLWSYMHGRKAVFAGFNVYGYACVPPTPFLLKDWAALRRVTLRRSGLHVSRGRAAERGHRRE